MKINEYEILNDKKLIPDDLPDYINIYAIKEYLENDIKQNEFYSIYDIDLKKSTYNIVYGERSNGKTSAGLVKILIRWLLWGEQGAYIRRYDDEIIGHKGTSVFSSLVHERKLIEEFTNGVYSGIQYYNRRWFLTKYDEKTDTNVKQSEPFCYALSVNNAESYKGTSFPKVTTIVYDEFMSRERYLNDEFVEFMNLLSTIIRHRGNVSIYMFGNTVNKYSPYFEEMGLDGATSSIEQGEIVCYGYRESDATVSVEYAESSQSKGGKESDKYFTAFENDKLAMITGGDWEIPSYPRKPHDITKEDVLDVFFIDYGYNDVDSSTGMGTKKIVQGNIVMKDNSVYIYMHFKSTDIRDSDVKQIYSLDPSPRYNHAVSILDKSRNKMAARIAELFELDLVYYATNAVGEHVRDYLHKSQSFSATKL